MRILELCPYSTGTCGVWTRVKQESIEFSKLGYDVKVFSSNLEKATNKIVDEFDSLNKIKIQRFPAKKLGGESFMNWNFKQQAIEFKPDIIIAHNYRHLHTTKALTVAKTLRKKGHSCKVFLVTHAPFVENNTTRSFFSKLAVIFYDKFIGPKTLKKFDKIIAITKWEIPYLKKLGVEESNITYIPNGIPEEFFTTPKTTKEENKILFLGRISPIKNLETAILALPLIKDKKTTFEIVGPADEKYLTKLKELTIQNKITKIKFSPAIYNLKKKIKKIDSAKIFILPSKREAMPQALIEAMARNKKVVASNNPGTRDIIEDSSYLFKTGDEKDLAEKINQISNKPSKNPKKSVEKFKWKKIIKKYQSLFNK